MMRLLRPPHIGIFPRSFRLHGAHHAREMIVEICSIWDALATAIITRTGSLVLSAKRGDVFRRDRRRLCAEAGGDVIGEAGDFRVGISAAEGRHGGARVGSLKMRAG